MKYRLIIMKSYKIFEYFVQRINNLRQRINSSLIGAIKVLD